MSERAFTLERIQQQVAACNHCSRLRTYCTRIAQEKRAAYRDETYWGRPVPGFGDPRARVLVLGLAPGAHGANRP
jgi:uracil-DNA glycosylase